MKNLLVPMALAAILVPGAAAQNLLEGTWKIDFTKAGLPSKPDEYLVQNGVYTCKTCSDTNAPIKADGTDQPLTGFPYADTLAIKVVNDHQIHLMGKKAGKVVAESTFTISADGKTLTEDFYFIPATGTPVKGKNLSKRVADGPPGSHAMSGSWQEQKMGQSETTFTYKIHGDELTMTDSMGDSYTARLDGTEAPYKGDPGTTSVRVKMVGANTLEETDLRDGKILYVSRMTVAADGKKGKVINEDKRQNTTFTFDVIKQ